MLYMLYTYYKIQYIIYITFKNLISLSNSDGTACLLFGRKINNEPNFNASQMNVGKIGCSEIVLHIIQQSYTSKE